MVLCFLCPGTHEGSTGSGSGFKAPQKTRPHLKVSSDRLGEAGNQPVTPGLQDMKLSPTPRRLLTLFYFILNFVLNATHFVLCFNTLVFHKP